MCKIVIFAYGVVDYKLVISKYMNMTKIAEYLSRHGESQANMAKRLAISRGYMCELASGKRTPSLEIAIAIQDATEGEIQPKDLLVGRAD